MESLQQMKVGDRAMFGRLAKIESVRLGTEDHGILTVYVFMDYGGCHQGFGGYALDEFSKKADRRIGTAYGADFILQLLTTFGVPKLEDMVGRYCYALFDRDGWNEPVRGLQTTPQDGRKVFLVDEHLKFWGIQPT